MLAGWFTVRRLIVFVSIGLILLGLSRMIEIRTPDRPTGSFEDIPRLAQRDDLNLVFILVDTLRADRLSADGYQRPTTPVLKALAQTGIRFTRVRSQSTWTKTSMASIWTSTYPATNKVSRYQHGLPDGVESPTELLKKAGFRTIGIWRNGWVAPNFGFGQGFDLYFRPAPRRQPNVFQKNPSAMKLPGTDHDVTLAANEFLGKVRPEERFFLYLHLMDVHQYVYDDTADFGSTYSDIYDNAVRWTDANIGTLYAALQNDGLAKRTIVVLAADHGEAFDEHGHEGHARDLYEETTHVPFMIFLPIRLDEPIVVDAPVENVDVWPTLLDLLGMKPMEFAQGRSLMPLVMAAARGEPAPSGEPRFRYAQLDRTWGQRNAEPRPMASVEDDRWRLFVQAKKPEATELYDHSVDPGEKVNLAKTDPGDVARLEQALKDYLALPAAPWGSPKTVPLSDFELGQLRALGYVVGGKEKGEAEAGGADGPAPPGDAKPGE